MSMQEAKEHRAELPESSDIVQILLKEIYNDHRIMCDIHRLSFTETLELYFAANKYMMDRLKEEALPRANAFLDVGAMSMTEVLETIPRVYEETGDGDPLRREFVSWANNVQVKTSLLAHVKEKEALRKLFQEVPDFAMDLFAKWGA